MPKLPLIIRLLGGLAMNRKNPPLPEKPVCGRWYRVNMPGLEASDGSEYGFDLRLGTESKLVIFFQGGGVSWDEHMAARPTELNGDTEDMYYFPRARHFRGRTGLFSTDRRNPFADWSVISLPYCTGDFHCGQADFPYTSLEGKQKLLRHHGYTNTMAALQRAKALVESPEKLLICGCSAGGFGTAFLADTVIDLFPETSDVSICDDSGINQMEDWLPILRDVWKAPEKIWKNVQSNDAVVDCLLALKERRPDVKILFACSKSDYTLAVAEGYRECGKMVAKPEYAAHFTHGLRTACERLTAASLFIFDVPAMGEAGKMGFTQHCILAERSAQTLRVKGKTALEWLWDGVNGKQEKIGLDLLKSQQG